MRILCCSVALRPDRDRARHLPGSPGWHHRESGRRVDDARSPQLVMNLGQGAASFKFLIRDRAGQFTGSFDDVFQADGIRILASPPQAPRVNAICERIVGTLHRELLDRLLIVNVHHLRQVLAEYLRHYNSARPYRALGQLTPAQAGLPATRADQRGGAPDPPQTSPRRTHPRVPRRRMSAHAATEERRSPARIVFPSPTRDGLTPPTGLRG
jgi:hypothetical protein